MWVLRAQVFLAEFKCLGECLRCFGKWSEASRRGGVNVLLARYLTVGTYRRYRR